MQIATWVTCLMVRDGWFFLDFDDFRLGPAVQDVWLIGGWTG